MGLIKIFMICTIQSIYAFFCRTSSELSINNTVEAFIISYVFNSERVITFVFCKFRDDKYMFLFLSFITKSDFLSSIFRFLRIAANSLCFGSFHRKIFHNDDLLVLNLIGQCRFTGQIFSPCGSPCHRKIWALGQKLDHHP